MAYQTPITIKRALEAILDREYVLPAIQRELVWTTRKIEMLFDSLMRGYPIASFLFWRVRREHTSKYRFYNFVTNYDARKPHNTPIEDVPGKSDLTAVLDGQQRLTALNIGLRGSYASKLPRLWWNNPNAFPKKRLYLNLRSQPDENEESLRYDFQFLTEKAARNRGSTTYWYPVGNILKVKEERDLIDFVHDEGLSEPREPQKLLTDLHRVVHRDGVIPYYMEESQDLQQVLNIFVRTNSGGTVLSRSDMLFSVATAQWDRYDAREEIHGFVDEINSVGSRFSFNKDFVLKACLMLTEFDTKFMVTNFNRANMSRIQDEWEQIKGSLRLAVQMAAVIGYDSTTLTSANSLLPLAYYFRHRSLTETWLTHGSHEEDRSRVRRWLIRALLKKGVWSGGPDTFLSGLRSVLREPSHQFPTERLEREMQRRGKGLSFNEEELMDLVDIRFGDARVYGVLALLYPFSVEVTWNPFHIDHVFPRAKMSRSALLRAGVPESEITNLRDRIDRLANLQLLPDRENTRKSATLPAKWLSDRFKDPDSRREYEERHDLTGLPAEVTGFSEFYDRRRDQMLNRLRQILSDPAKEAPP